jgi:5-dehydro-2-deoxygluconokinase
MTEKHLFILPFDHRRGFLEKEPEAAKKLKQIIYQGFLQAVKSGGVPKESAAILVDEQLGDKIIKDAVLNNYIVCVCVEKSGQDEFDFEYGDDFGNHLNKYHPTYVKALVRYNPEDNAELNLRQNSKLKRLNDFCKTNDYKFLVELLVPDHDNKTRLELTIKSIKKMQESKINPDIWKVEGLESAEDYKLLAEQVKSEGRDKAKIIILGQKAEDKKIEEWLLAGAKVPEVIGLAIGRTIFWQSLVDYNEGKISEKTAISQIAEKYQHFCQIFTNAK